MRKMICALIACMAITASAQVKLPQFFCDNMVLQQQTDARLWGWAKVGKTVKVTTSWNNQTASAKADKDGRWLVKVSTPKASYEPLEITFDDGDGKVTIKNVVAGEVWICATRECEA